MLAFEIRVLEGTLLQALMFDLFLLMIWCSLRPVDAIHTDRGSGR